MERATQQAERVAEQVLALRATLADLEATVAARSEEQARAEAAVQALAGNQSAALVAKAQAAWAAAEVERRSQEALLQQASEAQQRAEAELTAREQRLAGLTAEHTQLAASLAELQSSADDLQTEIDRLAAQIAPAEAEVDQLAAEQAQAEEKEALIRRQLHREEAWHHQEQLALERARDELERLRREIERELGIVALEPGAGEAGQPPLPIQSLAESLPVVTVPPEGLEEDIRRLRAHLSRLGNINPDAPAEYEEMLERHAFLSAQLADLNDAVVGLRQVIAELETLMERDFSRTFEQVARRFREYFTALFGGGSARLELTDPDNLSTTGIEIIARLPGKRAQSLALLSGGERSLTAAALIFALLEVNPPPFCVLDEVDAALDEANVGRFRETVKALSDRTQFILITHNRGTVEVADMVYGISMRADGTSQVLSLNMGELSEVA
ncbi:MAG: AAA family ATPase, partial [Anaerolineae bacterium]|nr:AAA family ATPase [Anaerolineae bacterium]